MKKKIMVVMTVLFMILLIVYSKSNIEAAKQGVEIWINNVFPSLFPFFVATEILSKTNFMYFLGKILEKPISKLFHVPGESAFALIMGIICGYPTGAKIVTELKEEEVLTMEESERLLAFTNNSGPLFIIGTVGVGFLGNQQIGYILLISHILACILVGICFRNWKSTKSESNHLMRKKQNKIQKSQNIGEILSNSIRNSLIAMANIGGFIVLFSVIISMVAFIPNSIR